MDRPAPIRDQDSASSPDRLVIAAVLLVGFLFFAAWFCLPAFLRAREEARKAVCMGQLKQLGLVMAMYAKDHADSYPATLEDLFPAYATERRLLRCPSDRSEGPSYVYVPGFHVEDRPNIVVAFDRRGNHQHRRMALFVDGHIESMSEESFQEWWAKQQEEFGLPSLLELGDRPAAPVARGGTRTP